jgi:uncharacterized damage-inducible protein DinB
MRIRILLLAVLMPVLATAKVQNTSKAAPAAAPQGFRAEFLANLDDVQQKIIALAEATPAEKFAWRSGNDVRSISEVYMHIAGGNYFLATFLGADAPKMNGDMEKTVTKKAEVIAELRKSFEHLRAAVNKDQDLEAPVKMFGKTTTRRGVLMTVHGHLSEHLGQSIAYARMNNIVPPWSH